MEQHFVLIQGFRECLFPKVLQMNWGKGTYVDLGKVKAKVTHLGYHH